eukprot:CAMPEP_0206136652 /NCGR_PEP_ID=MMETSP1473-20131121/1891_1 /ASSEMBLY_ACC=CAM_ASM_001109 /TAXON_ID=1461547 /ORGANISM="Stichococcus sp, Strain RCC1054" /LENGTH=812 /DNA_ID=CAMNT_0053529351 /DNA_START=361 /DNA_END=2799 /DNA_ORIENTATION=-
MWQTTGCPRSGTAWGIFPHRAPEYRSMMPRQSAAAECRMDASHSFDSFSLVAASNSIPSSVRWLAACPVSAVTATPLSHPQRALAARCHCSASTHTEGGYRDVTSASSGIAGQIKPAAGLASMRILTGSLRCSVGGAPSGRFAQAFSGRFSSLSSGGHSGDARKSPVAPSAAAGESVAGAGTAEAVTSADAGDSDGSAGGQPDPGGTPGGAATARGDGKRLRALRRGISQDLESVQKQEEEEKASRTLRARLAGSFRAAFQTYYTVLFYNTVVRLLKAVGADSLFAWITPRLETGYATLSGTWYTLHNGKRRPFSLANNYDPDFNIPPQYSAQEFPFTSDLDLEAEQSFDWRTAHLMSLAMKLVYEHNDVIEDTVKYQWGLQPLAIIETASMEASEADKSFDDLSGDLHVKKRRGGSDSRADNNPQVTSHSSNSGGRGESGRGKEDTIPGSKGTHSTKRDIQSHLDSRDDTNRGRFDASGTRGSFDAAESNQGGSSNSGGRTEAAKGEAPLEVKIARSGGSAGASDGGEAASGEGKLDKEDTESGEQAFLPSSKAILFRSEGGIIIAFRGTEATNLLNWRTNITINMTRHKTLGGIHDGFYAALFHRPAGGGTSLFEDIVQALRDAEAAAAEEGRAPCPLFISGHSLGGAIASVFAQALAVQEPELAARVGAVYTWGQPRAGDAAFARIFTTAYGDRTFRIRNAGDIVPFLIPSWLGYRHCGREMFLSTFGGMKSTPEEIKGTTLYENIGFPFIYVYDIFAGRLGQRRESWLRTLYRISFIIAAPGFTNHFPCAYELKMRAALKGEAPKSGR